LRGSSAVERLLEKYAAATIRVYAVWEPIQPIDVAPPITYVLSRLPDRRVRQYWDPKHLVSRQMTADARKPQPTQECCVRSGNLWDLAAVYPKGASWAAQLPPATVFNGPIVDVTEAIEAALVSAR
jgi:hypothetical protein